MRLEAAATTARTGLPARPRSSSALRATATASVGTSSRRARSFARRGSLCTRCLVPDRRAWLLPTSSVSSSSFSLSRSREVLVGSAVGDPRPTWYSDSQTKILSRRQVGCKLPRFGFGSQHRRITVATRGARGVRTARARFAAGEATPSSRGVSDEQERNGRSGDAVWRWTVHG